MVIAPIATVLADLTTHHGAPPRRLTRQNAVSIRDVTIWPAHQSAELGHGMQAVLDMNKDPSVSVKRDGHTIWRFMARRLHPWKLVTADVDGDGRREMILGVYKATRFRPYPHPCLFIYGWKESGVFPMWRGSALSKPFTDFTFVHCAGTAREELAAIEVKADGNRCITTYHWSGFGFSGDTQVGSWKTAQIRSAHRNEVLVVADGRSRSFKVETTK